MKKINTKLLRIVFPGIFMLLAIPFPVPAQDEPAYQKALSEAYAQGNPSEYRAQALKKLLDAPENKRMSESKLNEFVAAKFKALLEIDFYAAFLAQSMPVAEIIKWHEVFELLPPEQVAAIKKLNQWKAAGGSKAAYPAGIPQPGYGWNKTVSSNVRPKNPPAAAAANVSQSNSPVEARPNAQSSEAYLRGTRQFDVGDFDAALRSFSECITANPKADACYLNRGLTHAKKQNYEAAIADYTEAIKLAPQKEQAYINRGVAHNAREDQEAAAADFETALKINPNNEKVKEVLQATRKYQAAKKNYLATEQKQSRMSDDFLQQGNQKFGQKNYAEAIPLYTKCIAASPLNLDCYNYRGLAYGALKDYDKAIADFTTILLFKPLPIIYFRRALAQRDKKDLDAAIKDFTEAVKLAPGDAENFMERGATYIFKGDFARAAADLTEAIRLKPQEPKYYFIRGYAYQSSGSREPAIADYKKALQIDPNFAAARKQLEGLGAQL